MKFIPLLCILLCQCAIGVAQVSDAGQTKKWSLDDCIAYALENNITILDAELSKENADISLTKSKFQHLPSLTANAGQNFSFGNAIDPITSRFVSQQVQSTSFTLNSQVVLFQGNQINNGVKQNKLNVNLNEYYVKEAKNNITISVTEAFVQALYNKEAILVSENNLKLSETQLVSTKAKYDAGSIVQKEFLDAQTTVATNKYNLTMAQNDYVQQILKLKQLLEIGPYESFDIVEPNVNENGQTLIPDKNTVYEYALISQPSIKAEELNTTIGKLDLKIAKGNYLPTLSLTGSIGTGYTSTQQFDFTSQLNQNFNQKVGFSLSVPIFNKYTTKAQVETAKINIKKSELKLTTAQKELYQTIESAWQNAVSAQQQLLSAQEALNASKLSFEQAQKQYQLGALTAIDLVTYQNSYSNAQYNYLQGKYLSILYTQLLQFYLGNTIKL